MEMSRRSFVAGTAAAVGATAAAGLAVADEAAEAPAKGAWSWSEKPADITDDQISQTIDCDVCIVGLGAGGAPSALYAATHGLSTVVLQKGDHAISNGWCANAINNKAYLATGGEPFDTTELFADFINYTNGRENGTLVRMFIERGGEVMNWVLDQTTEIEPQIVEQGQTIGWFNADDFQSRYARFAELLKLMSDKAEEAGAQMLWDTPAVRLCTSEDGATVTGAIGQNADG